MLLLLLLSPQLTQITRGSKDVDEGQMVSWLILRSRVQVIAAGF
jgi:hypothetical protein